LGENGKKPAEKRFLKIAKIWALGINGTDGQKMGLNRGKNVKRETEFGCIIDLSATACELTGSGNSKEMIVL